MQAVAALLAVIVTAPALYIALITYQDQVAVTQAQLESTQLERRRYQERYAARVSYWEEWMTVGKRSFRAIKVQNRSPVPITHIQVVAFDPERRAGEQPDNEVVAYIADAIAVPCSILTFGLRVTHGIRQNKYDEAEYQDTPVLAALRFTDPVQRWEDPMTGYPPFDGPRRLRSYDGQLRAVPRDGLGGLTASEVPDTRQQAGDCGEGS